MMRKGGVLILVALAAGCRSRAETLATYPVGEFRPEAQERIVPAGATFERVWNDGDFTEGPAPAADGTVLFSDIGNRIMRYDPKSGKCVAYRDPSGKTNGLVFDGKGRLLACEGANGGNRRLSIDDGKGRVATLADRWNGKRFNSPNDLAVAPNGDVYFTDPRYAGDEPRELDFEGVFRVSTGGAVTLATRDVEKPNGILVTSDGRWVWLADNNSDPKGAHLLLRFRVGADGALIDKRVAYDFGPDRRGIDGMAMDVEGNIYATAGKSERAGIYVFDPRGRRLAFIATPGTPTNCAFAGSTLYVTAEGPEKRRWALYRIGLAVPGS